MSKLMSPGQSRLAIQICAASAVAALLSGCSSDVSRFNDPFSNPFSTASKTTKPQHVASSKPVGTGRTPPVVAQALPPRPTTFASAAPIHSSGSAISHETTGSIEPPRSVAGASFGGWSSSGGASVVVAQGETADVLSKRYGVPQNVLLQVNGLKGPAELQPGARIVVPIYNAVASAQGAAAAPRTASATPAALPHPAPVAPAKMSRIAAATPKAHEAATPKAGSRAAPTRLAKAEPVQAAVEPRRKMKVIAPARVATAAPARLLNGAAPLRTAVLEPAPRTRPAQARIAALPQPAKATAVATQPVRTAALKAAPVKAAPPAAAPKAEQVAVAAGPKAVDPTPTASVPVVAEAGPEFRWPARGRIIQGFKGGTGGNDGINIAVPEGTAVKAAEGGVVAYAGSELKGYGNLVLIRHPNGFVSAYANNGEIDVKRGDTVKRGQTIAKSGQSGNVASPQLHFELRKGSQPVDPTQYLAGL